MMKDRKILEKSAGEYDLFRDSPAVDREILLSRLYPPLPVAGDRLIWGFHIIRKAGEMNVEQLRVAEIEGGPADFLCVALKLENRRDGYSWPELVKIAGFMRLHDCSSRLAEIEALVQTTGSFLKRVDLFESLPPGPKSLVISSFVDVKTAGKLKNFSEPACSALIDRAGGLSTSEKRKLVLYVNETGLRDNLDEKALSDLAAKIISSDDPLQAAYSMRYPTLTSMEKSMNTFRNRYLKGTGVQLTPPPGFEGDSILVSFRCRSKKELTQRAERLKKITDKTDEIFDLLF